MRYSRFTLKFYATLVFLFLSVPLSHPLVFANTRNFDTYNEFYQGGSGAVSSQSKINSTEAPDDSTSGFISLKENIAAPKISSWEEYTEFSKNIESTNFKIGATTSFGDINGDGYPDLIVGQSKTFKAYRNTDTSTSKNTPSWSFDSSLSPSINIGANNSNLKFDLIDFDKDGLQDLVYGYTFASMNSVTKGHIRLSINSGTANNPSWSSVTSTGFLYSSTMLDPHPAMSDLDNDGNFDLVIGGLDGTLEWFKFGAVLADGRVQYNTTTAFNSGLEGFDVGVNSAPAFSDLDGDGDLDLVVGALNGSLSWFRNWGSASSPKWEPWPAFGDGVITPAAVQGSVPSFADLDNDGDSDLLIADLYGNLKWFRKNTKPYFTSGTYTSHIIDTGWSLTGSSISWTETVSSVTSNSTQVRSSSLPDMSDAPPFGNCFVNNGDNLSKSLCVKTFHRYVQFFDTLKTTDNRATPKLDSVQLNFSSTNPYFSFSEEAGYENGVNPVFGATTDNFTYKILYYDSTTPTGLIVNLVVDGTIYPMTQDSSYFSSCCSP